MTGGKISESPANGCVEPEAGCVGLESCEGGEMSESEATSVLLLCSSVPKYTKDASTRNSAPDMMRHPVQGFRIAF